MACHGGIKDIVEVMLENAESFRLKALKTYHFDLLGLKQLFIEKWRARMD